MDGSIENRLPLTADLDEIKATLLFENMKFNATEERKDYSRHVMSGKRAGINYESEIPYGEDLDGDGEIDQSGRRGGGGGIDQRGRRGPGGGMRREGRRR